MAVSAVICFSTSFGCAHFGVPIWQALPLVFSMGAAIGIGATTYE